MERQNGYNLREEFNFKKLKIRTNDGFQTGFSNTPLMLHCSVKQVVLSQMHIIA